MDLRHGCELGALLKLCISLCEALIGWTMMTLQLKMVSGCESCEALSGMDHDKAIIEPVVRDLVVLEQIGKSGRLDLKKGVQERSNFWKCSCDSRIGGVFVVMQVISRARATSQEWKVGFEV